MCKICRKEKNVYREKRQYKTRYKMRNEETETERQIESMGEREKAKDKIFF